MWLFRCFPLKVPDELPAGCDTGNAGDLGSRETGFQTGGDQAVESAFLWRIR